MVDPDDNPFNVSQYPFVQGELWIDPTGNYFWIARATQTVTAYVDNNRTTLTPGTTYQPLDNNPTAFYTFNEAYYTARGYTRAGFSDSEIHVRPEDFGAVGNGVVDDYKALAAALTTAQTLGGTVELTRGKTYYFNGVLNILTNVVGNNATLKPAGVSDRPVTLGSNIQVSDLTVDAGSTPTAATVYGNGTNIRLSRATVKTTALTGAGIRYNNCTFSSVQNCTVQGFANAINIAGGHDNVVEDTPITGTFAGVLVNPFGLVGAVDIDIVRVTVSQFPAGVALGYPIRSAGTSTAHNTRIRFIECKVVGPNLDFTQNGTADQINMVYTDGATWFACHSYYGGDMGISCTNCNYISITSCVSMFNDTGGIVVSNGCTFATVTGNTSVNNGQNRDGGSPATSSFGIGTGGGSNVMIGQNVIGDDQAIHTQQYGVRVMFGGDTITYGPNVNHGNGTADFYTDGLATNVIAK